MSAQDTPWYLYRYHNGDGTKKDWAYRQLPDHTTEIAWGRTGQITHRKIYCHGQGAAIEQRADGKQRKGYVPLGQAVLRGLVFEVISTQRAPLSFNPVAQPKPQPRMDRSWIAPGQDDFWF